MAAHKVLCKNNHESNRNIYDHVTSSECGRLCIKQRARVRGGPRVPSAGFRTFGTQNE